VEAEAGRGAATEESPLGGRAYLRLILLGALIGIPAALVAAGFLAVVHQLQHWLWDTIPDDLGRSSPPWYLLIGLPALGGCIVLAARRLLPGDGGHDPLGGLSTKPTPLSYGPGVLLAALGTLPFGAVLGPEAPLMALGSVVALSVTPLVKLGAREQAVLATAGSMSAVSAVFGGPLVAGVLMVEAGVGMGAMLIPILIPGLVAAAIGYLLFTGLGNWAGIQESLLTVPGLPAYTHERVLDLVVGLCVGIAAALLLAAVRRYGARVAEFAKPRMAAGLILGGVAVGVLALLARALGGNSQDVLFSGETAVPHIITEGSFGVLIVVLAAKALGYAISLGSGFRGGPVFPAIFIGVALATAAVILFDVSPTLAVAVGTAAGMAAMTRLVIAGLFFAVLLVGSNGFDAIPAAVLASAAAYVTTEALDRRARASATAGRGGA
jgi:H+/Cl- antiporter ClcA